mmetsp:Transcript_35643/g.57655  ORF Transcript_35643/g.57655 Transcript_35643/m.57655 type:complete len:467 (-) Transcript_35643:336-1736(-)|eukprot:CAMPEP_0184338690 /NCGR_PEP_ID=MMETSP1089-20130417/7277_1 /TAXON_ID=38269 ORGANISM="Gloeochaete wittrockiana, Strain SAG46.84" /NCGR_SAMPLE_ID=MMETSP1089 /ASSEMBLY_ACC=CAM_ASM_000445 /LENGTH=466 /DNA_ID=CAMNT_0026665399 /DNA_START=41 /DNA_END=1441 /DNA_ORIENTATION=-
MGDEHGGKKKRGAERQITKDTDDQDDFSGEQPDGFRAADPSVIAQRRIVKARRPGASKAAASVPSSVAGSAFAAAFAAAAAATTTPLAPVASTFAVPAPVPPSPAKTPSQPEPVQEKKEESPAKTQPAEKASTPEKQPTTSTSDSTTTATTTSTTEAAASSSSSDVKTEAAPSISSPSSSSPSESKPPSATSFPINFTPPAPGSFSFSFAKPTSAPSSTAAAAAPAPAAAFSFSSPPTFNFTFAPPPPSTEEGSAGRLFGINIIPSAKTGKAEDEEGGGAGGSGGGGGGEQEDTASPEEEVVHDFTVAKPPVMAEAPTATGEEGDETLFQIRRAKLYHAEGGQFRERGVGAVRVNMDKGSQRSRIIMRVDHTARLILNARIFPKMLIEKASDKQVRLTSFEPDPSGKLVLHTYLIKVGSPTDAEDFVEVLERQRKEAEERQQREGGTPKKAPAEESDSKTSEKESS